MPGDPRRTVALGNQNRFPIVAVRRLNRDRQTFAKSARPAFGAKPAAESTEVAGVLALGGQRLVRANPSDCEAIRAAAAASSAVATCWIGVRIATGDRVDCR
jgi:hypothetical protein